MVPGLENLDVALADVDGVRRSIQRLAVARKDSLQQRVRSCCIHVRAHVEDAGRNGEAVESAEGGVNPNECELDGVGLALVVDSSVSWDESVAGRERVHDLDRLEEDALASEGVLGVDGVGSADELIRLAEIEDILLSRCTAVGSESVVHDGRVEATVGVVIGVERLDADGASDTLTKSSLHGEVCETLARQVKQGPKGCAHLPHAHASEPSRHPSSGCEAELAALGEPRPSVRS